MMRFHNVIQKTEEWHALRRGILTASEVSTILTPTKLEPAKGATVEKFAMQLAVDRIFNYPHDTTFSTWHTERGQIEEEFAREEYQKRCPHAIERVGFVTNTFDGVTIGCSPDGYIKPIRGLVEIKSRINKEQMAVLIRQQMPDDYRLQVQCAMLVCECEWLDFVSYSNGMPLFVKRIHADKDIQEAILVAAMNLETMVREFVETYKKNTAGLSPVEWRDYQQLFEIQV